MRISTWIIVAFLALAAIGFADSAFLTAQHLQGLLPPCSDDSACNVVLTSEYATVAGVPIAALGALYYAVLIILMVAYLDTWNRKVLHWASWATTAGLLASVYLVGVQLFAIGSFCPYCLVSAGASTGLFAIGVVIMRRD
jgi:uncharacterized membrane protein